MNHKITCDDINSEEFEIKIICKKNSDKEYRNACLETYACSVLDLKPTEFELIKKDSVKNKKGLIDVIKHDIESRLTTLLE